MGIASLAKYKKTGRDESLPVRTRPFSDLFNVAASRPAKSPRGKFHKPVIPAGQWANVQLLRPRSEVGRSLQTVE
jgi:hypothetical protein